MEWNAKFVNYNNANVRHRRLAHTFINDMSMHTPPFGARVWPSIDVAPPYGTIGT